MSAAAYPVLAYYPTTSLHTKESKNLAVVNEINLEEKQIAENEQVMWPYYQYRNFKTLIAIMLLLTCMFLFAYILKS